MEKTLSRFHVSDHTTFVSHFPRQPPWEKAGKGGTPSRVTGVEFLKWRIPTILPTKNESDGGGCGILGQRRVFGQEEYFIVGLGRREDDYVRLSETQVECRVGTEAPRGTGSGTDTEIGGGRKIRDCEGRERVECRKHGRPRRRTLREGS